MYEAWFRELDEIPDMAKVEQHRVVQLMLLRYVLMWLFFLAAFPFLYLSQRYMDTHFRLFMGLAGACVLLACVLASTLGRCPVCGRRQRGRYVKLYFHHACPRCGFSMFPGGL